MFSHPILCLSFTISLLILPITAGPLRAVEDEENANSATENDGPENDQIEGFAINAQFLCNGLPLIGAVQILDEVENCSQIVLHLDIPDRETTLDLLEPFDRWNATFQIACSQRASHFDAQKPPVLTVIHNCSPNETAESVQQGEQVCRKWDIPVPEENIGQNPKIVQLGTQELSEHGEEIDCPENVALMMRADEEEEEAEEAEIEAIEELEQMENAVDSVVEPAQESGGGEEQEPEEENEEEQQFDEGTTTQMPFGSNGEEQETEE